MWLVALAAVVVLVAALSARFLRREPDVSGPRGVSYQAQRLLVNGAERAAWEVLQGAVQPGEHVFAKVRLEAVVAVRAVDQGARGTARGHIKSRQLDFLVVDSDFRPILAVELDEGRHRSPRAADGDAHKRQALAAAGIPLVRLPVGADWRALLSAWRAGGSPGGRPA